MVADLRIDHHHYVHFVATEDEFDQSFLDAILAATERLRIVTEKLEAALKPRK